jgi:hypothetical protein
LLLAACYRPAELPVGHAWILGVWEERLAERVGCSDKVTISAEGRNLVLEGKNCKDGSEYRFSDVAYDGTTLWLKLVVPQTRIVLDYSLHRLPDGTLTGFAGISGAERGGSYIVRWVRAR